MPPPVAYVPPPPARRSRGPIIAIVVLAMLVAALGGVVVARELNAPTDVTLEPVATAGANPFMESVGTDVPDVRPVAHTGGSWSGTTPGLYGGSGSNAVCDRSRLSRFLGEHPDRAAGWASVLGLRDSSASTISSYVDGLTSVVLRSDTYVTNHGWSGGHVTAWPAVLQAGTAVLVDQHGNLVTRCFCGNPLTAPQSFNTVAYVGPRWYSFTSSSVTVITHQTTQVTNNFTIIDVHTGRGHDRPHGSDGEEDVENRQVQATFPEDEGTTTGQDPQAGGQTSDGAQGGATGQEPEAGGETSDGAEGGATDPNVRAGEAVPVGGTTPVAGSEPEDTPGDTTGDTPGDTTGDTTGDGTAQRRGAPAIAPDATTSSSTTTPPSSTTTTSGTSATSAGEPSGAYTASGCEFASGTLTFTSDQSYTSTAGDSGSWAMESGDLVVTPVSGSPVTFTGSTRSWTSPSGSCTLTAVAS
ncbi:DUF6777 domain-containing protein [Actinomycetospora flava]|uniref:DUF6777 domain-containing protein n=1 Tax=Actinomycetospora flava TaxID=3129232 RepID=A0ABU8M2B7_9PSEU